MSCPREMFVAACSKTDLDQVRSLLQEGSDVNWRRKQDGWSGLYWAARHNCQDLLQLLLAQRGLDVNIRDHLGRTPLMAACYHGHDGIARRLCQTPRAPAELQGQAPVHSTALCCLWEQTSLCSGERIPTTDD